MQIVKPDAVSTTGYITRSGVGTYYDSNGILQTSTSGALRFTHDPYTKEFLGIMLEDSSTNICKYSEELSNTSGWTRGAAITSISTNTIVAPDGNTTADLITSTGGITGTVYQDITVTPSTTYTFSAFVKLGTLPASLYGYAAYNLTNPSFIFQEGNSSGVVFSDRWTRIYKTFTTPAGCTSIRLFAFRNEQGFLPGANSASVWGCQLEAKSLPTSYIKTNSVTASRSAEVITGDGLLYTSVTNPYSEWSSSSVSYTIGQYVVVGTYNNATAGISTSSTASGTYRCLVNHTSSVSNGPLQSSTNWVRTGPTNQFAMFDNVVSSVSSATTEFTFVIKSTSVDTIAVLNAVGNKIIAAVSDASYSETHLGNVAYNRTTQLSGTESIDWYSYFFFDEDTQKTQALYLNIPQEADGVITIRVTGSGTVSAGSIVTGQIKEIGQTQYGVNTGIIDYSRKETDEFGNTSLVVRNYSKRMNAQVFLTNANLNRVQRLLYSIRATPVLWIGSTDSAFEEPLVVLGYYKDFDTEIAYPAHSLCNLQIEGLI